MRTGALIILKFARKVVKSQPYCKRVGHSIFCDLVFSTISWSIGEKAPQQYLSEHTIVGEPNILLIEAFNYILN